MIIEYSEADDSRVRWNSGGEWKSDDIEELIAAYEWKQSIPRHGDLIDRDALEKDFIDLSEDEWNKKTGTSWARAFEEAADVVYNAPTVIEKDWSE